MLSGRRMVVQPDDFAALLTSVVIGATYSRVGFDHILTDLPGWLRSIAPYGITLDQSFVEDMLCSGNLLNECGKFRHPTGKTFEQCVRTTVRVGQVFDAVSNTIQEKRRHE
jgi:hypothetical protein